MKSGLAAGMVAALIAADVANASTPAWKFLCYPGFVESVDALVGADAVDCQFLDRREEELPDVTRQSAADCVAEALEEKKPFKFGTVQAGSDVVYVLMRSAANELWTVRYSRNIANQHLHETQVNQVCANVMFDAATLLFHGIDCKLVSNGGLPTYVRPNPGH